VCHVVPKLRAAAHPCGVISKTDVAILKPEPHNYRVYLQVFPLTLRKAAGSRGEADPLNMICLLNRATSQQPSTLSHAYYIKASTSGVERARTY
jgi:hypothetical protein